MQESFLRLPEVMKRTGLHRSTIYSRIADDNFPKPVAIGARAVAWVESEVAAWIDQRIQAGRGAVSGKAA